LAIWAGEEGEDPSSSSLSPDNGICPDNDIGGGEGALNLGLVSVGLLLFVDVGMPSEDLLLWYFGLGEGRVEYTGAVLPLAAKDVRDEEPLYLGGD